MKTQRLYSLMRQAMDDYQMIEEGDKIAVGVSGGMDSLTLLYGLAGLREFYPKKFSVVAVTVHLGYEGFDTEPIKRLCEKLDVEYYVVHTKINEMLEDGQCSLCARLRKGAFNQYVLDLGCNKVAYAHNLDDVVETMMLSLIYEGRFSTFWPVTHWDKTNLSLIRPMIYVKKEDVIGFSNANQLEIVKNPCPFEKKTKRGYVRELIRQINKEAPGVKTRMMRAVLDGNIEEWKNKNVKE